MAVLKKFLLTFLLFGSYLPVTSHAHTEADLLHGMTDGASLFFTSAQYALLVLVTGLMNSRVTQYRTHHSVLIFFAGLFAGILFYYTGIKVSSMQVIAHVYLIVLGLVVLTDFDIRSAALVCLYLITGMFIGLGLAVDIENGMMKTVISMSVILLAIIVFSASVTASRLAATGWQRISVRIIASWVAAIAIVSMVVQHVGLENAH